MTFNDHEGSTKSYAREERRGRAGGFRAANGGDYDRLIPVLVSSVMMHDGSWVRLRKVSEDYDPTDRDRSFTYIRERQEEGEVVGPSLPLARLARRPRAEQHRRDAARPGSADQLCPGSAELEKLQLGFR